MNELTKIQQKILSFVVGRQAATGAPPTIREIARNFGFKSPNAVREHLRLIERKGHIRRRPREARGIEIVSAHIPPRPASRDLVMAPLVGAIAAGTPITAEQNITGHVTLDGDLFRGSGLFALRVKGNSMRDIGVIDGDIAVIRPQASVDDGEVAAVIMEDEATLKRVLRRDGRLVLRAENPDFADIHIGPDRAVRIAGKLEGVVRKC